LAAIKIRTKEGIDFKWFRTRTGYDFLKLESESLEELSRDGLFKYRKRKGRITGIYLTRKGFCFADSVSSALV
jgi:coproporphyrinogen III oxidase-like Fe-S oxidoreductase